MVDPREIDAQITAVMMRRCRTSAYPSTTIAKDVIPQEIGATRSKAEPIKIIIETNKFTRGIGLASAFVILPTTTVLTLLNSISGNIHSTFGTIILILALVSLAITTCTIIAKRSIKEVLGSGRKSPGKNKTLFYHPDNLPGSTKEIANQWRIHSSEYREYVNNIMVLKKIYPVEGWERTALGVLVRIQMAALRQQDPRIISWALPLSREIVQTIWLDLQLHDESKAVQPKWTSTYEQYRHAYTLSGESWVKKLLAIEDKAEKARQGSEDYLIAIALDQAIAHLQLSNPEIQFDQQIESRPSSAKLAVVSSIESKQILSS